MTDFTILAREHRNLSESAQKQAGQAIGGSMDEEHKNFLKTVTEFINSGEIDFHVPETLLKIENYQKLSPEARAQVDLSLVNIADFLRHITEFFLSKRTPDESPHLETMIEQLWQMKEKVEQQYGDVFKL